MVILRHHSTDSSHINRLIKSKYNLDSLLVTKAGCPPPPNITPNSDLIPASFPLEYYRKILSFNRSRAEHEKFYYTKIRHYFWGC